MRKILFWVGGIALIIIVAGFVYRLTMPFAPISPAIVEQAQAVEHPAPPVNPGNPELIGEKNDRQLMPDRILGSAQAPVTIIEYASLTCPHCAHFHKETLPRLKADFIDKGLVKLALRPFPFDGVALKGSILAYCLDPQQYYPFVGAVFESQDQWARSKDPEGELKKIARLAGLTDDKMNQCLADTSGIGASLVRGRQEGEKLYGVTSTPSFIIGSEKLDGARPYDQFAILINEKLKAARP